MVIDTKEVTSWISTHAKICIPVGLGILSRLATGRWQSAIDHQSTAFMIFFFSVAATSGITSAISTINYLVRIGVFE